jgi:hypothetical protein
MQVLRKIALVRLQPFRRLVRNSSACAAAPFSYAWAFNDLQFTISIGIAIALRIGMIVQLLGLDVNGSQGLAS